MKFHGSKAVFLYDYLLILAGAFISALAINIFIVPYKIAPGGVSGIATVIYYLSNGRFPVGLTSLVLNIPLFITGFKLIGAKFAARTLFGTVLLSLFIDITVPYTVSFEKFLGIASASSSEILLYAIFGGFFTGVGLGMVFKSGATTGGSDLAARILHRYIPHLTIGQLLLIVDTIIVIFAGIAFGSFQLGLYALVTMFLTSKMIDTVLEGINFAKAALIISDHSEEIAQKLLKELDRGVTGLYGKGMYTGTNKNILLCVLNRGQIDDMRSIVSEVDEAAFVILADIREVYGDGFR